MKELNFIDEFYNKIKETMNKNISLNKVITVQYKIDIYTKLYEFCTADDVNTEFVYQKYESLLIDYCNELKNNQLDDNIIINMNLYIDKYNLVVKRLYFVFNYLDRHHIKLNDLMNLKEQLPKKILIENLLVANMDNYTKKIE